MKGKNKRWAALILIMLFLGICKTKSGVVLAASSYTNAKEFYESTGKDTASGQHIEVNNGNLYYATSAKVATSSSNLKYVTVGYDITLIGSGQSMDIAVKRGETLGEVAGSSTESGGYQYLLYRISYEDIQKLAKSCNASLAEVILDSSTVIVRMNAIITTKKGNSQNGDISENGDGSLNEWGAIYHLKNDGDLQTAQKIFSGHTFESYVKIERAMPNNTLTIKYNLQSGMVGNGYSTKDDLLCLNGSVYNTQSRQMKEITLVNQSFIGLNRAGYHIDDEREWTTENRYFNHKAVYLPIDICPSIAGRSQTITVYANWQPNVYTVAYDSNKGTGYMMDNTFSYDSPGTLRPNGYSREGYTFKGWNTAHNGSGTAFTDRHSILNLTQEHGKTVTLYAQWEAVIYTITTDKQKGTGGTNSFYEKYSQGWYEDKAGKKPGNNLTVPGRKGYEFLGYYSGMFGFGMGVVNGKGNIQAKPDYFSADGYVYGDWKARQYTITFNKQEGMQGTDTAAATYDSSLPEASAPVRPGYTFQGYYTQTGGKGIKYYNETMMGMQRYLIDGNLTLYAYWIDTTPPQVILNANVEIWTKNTVVLSAEASDSGSSLSSVTIYQGSTKVAEKKDLSGTRTYTLNFNNAKEGAVTYKAVASDMAGNKAESYKTIYFDKTAPRGNITSENKSGTNLDVEVFVTDYKVGD